MKLLIVNDVVPTMMFIRDNIEWGSYGIGAVYTAYDAEESRAVLSAHKIDIILCDIQMPGESGLELIRWVGEQGLDCECVFLTCPASFEYAKEAIQLGCSDYIVFPASAQSIGEAVQKVAERRRKRQEGDRIRQYGQYMLNSITSGMENDSPTGSSPEEIVNETIRYILENIASSDLNVNALASRSCLNLSYFSRLFKKIAGVSASQFIIQERMLMASDLLKNTKIPVNTIALNVGYNSFPHFTMLFKKYYDCTPTHFREKFT